jgi:hypothetical protein
MRPSVTLRRSSLAIAGFAAASLLGVLGSVASGGCASQGATFDVPPDQTTREGSDAADAGRDATVAADSEIPIRSTESQVSQAIIVNQTTLAVRLCPLEDGLLIKDFPEATGGLKKPPFPASRVMPQSNRLGIEPGGAAYISEADSKETPGDYVRGDFRRGNAVAIINQADVGRGALCTESLVRAAVQANGPVSYPSASDASGIYVITQKGGKFTMTWTAVFGLNKNGTEFGVSYVGEVTNTESLRLSVGEGANSKTFAEGASRGGSEVVLANEVFVDEKLNARNFETSSDGSKVSFSQGMVQTAAFYDPTISPSIYFGQKVTYAALMVDAPQKHLLVLPLRNPGVPVKERMEDAGADAGDAGK